MIRKIVNIDEEKCNGCGQCAAACHEGAIGIINGKARLIKDDYCDGFGDCLPECPTGALTITEREAADYDREAVEVRMKQKIAAHGGSPAPHVCPGSMAKTIRREAVPAADPAERRESCLAQWPVQIKLVPTKAPFYQGGKLLVAADCTAYAYAAFHEDFMRGRVTIIGCPKLDDVDYTEKLTEIIRDNDIRSLTIVRMEVPCCGGLERAAKTALQNSGKFIPWRVVTVSAEGKLLDD
ncbi:MAG: 4Fe-4S binding protein [Fretibacterium sp.]|nr:4Fe-4S binding protein [Fretibacterium sp.]